MHRTCTQPGWWAGRPGRSTAIELLLSGKGPGRPTRSTGRELCSLYLAPVDRTVDRPESSCSLDLARSTGRSTGRLNGRFFDRWPVDRPVDRKVIFDLSACQWAEFCGGYKYRTFELFLNKFLRAKISDLFKCFKSKFFKRVFGFKRSIFICF